MSDQLVDAPSEDAVWAAMTITATAEVQHHAPCVPECPVCYPTGEDEG